MQKLWLSVVGIALLVFCAYWWVSSARADRFRSGHRLWVPTYQFLGLDFGTNYYAVQRWWEGDNPYVPRPDAPRGAYLYNYSPAVIWMFTWCRCFDWITAIWVWIAALGLIASLGGVFSWLARRELGISRLPLPFILGVILCSTPIIFAMERANYDLLVLLFIIAAIVFLRRSGLVQDILAGFCLALAAWAKPYAGLLVLGLLSARRLRVAICLVVVAGLIGAADIKGTIDHVQILRELTRVYDCNFHPCAHPLSTYWRHFWTGTRLDFLAVLPGTWVAIATVLPLGLWVSYHFYRCPHKEPLIYPYFCWLTALATFVPEISNDYNFFFLPLAALAVWARRDPPVVHVLMSPLLLWWQPFQLPIGGELIFFFKVGGLVAVGISLVGRAREYLAPATTQAELHATPISVALTRAA